MTGVLSLVVDADLRGLVERAAAAAAVKVVHAAEPSSRRVWASASAVVVDTAGARRCAELGLPRRSAVLVVAPGEPAPADWAAAIAVGAQRVVSMPADEARLVAELSDAAAARDDARRGAVVAVIGGCGGAGASVFATALAQAAPQPLLVDVDPWSGGLDLTAGCEEEAGLRWPDLAVGGGRVGYPALCAALPSRHGVAVLSSGREGEEIDGTACAAVLDGACRGGATAVCDLPRRATAAAGVAVDAADLVVVVVPADLRSAAAATTVGRWVALTNPNVGLVVRGPAPGGLRAADVARVTGLPLLASMRYQPGLAADVERDGLRPRRRSPLATAARRVLAVLARQP